jgi:hypothetical protein
MTEPLAVEKPAAPVRRRRWPWLVLAAAVLLLAAYVAAARSRGPSWEWAGKPIPPGTPVVAAGRVIETGPSNFEATMAQAAPGDVVILSDGEYSGGLTDPPRQQIDSTSPMIVSMILSKTISVKCSGLKGKPIALKAKGSGAVFTSGLTLDGVKWFVVDGLIFRNNAEHGLTALSCENLTIRNCTIDGTQTTRALHVETARRVIIEGNEVFGTPKGSGICLLGECSDCVIRCNRVHDVWGCGIVLDKGDHTGKWLSRCLVERNIVWHCGVSGGSAIGCADVLFSMFRNNLLFKNSGSGIGFSRAWENNSRPNVLLRAYAVFRPRSPDSRRNIITGNTVYIEPGKGRNALNLIDSSRNFYVHNNIFFGGLGGAVLVTQGSMSGLDMDDNVILTHKGQNLLGDRYPTDRGPLQGLDVDNFASGGITVYTVDGWHGRGFDLHSTFNVDPFFVSVEKDDYGLSPKSPAIDCGADITRFCPLDIDGVKRPQGKGFDCGAYEYVPPTGGEEESKK